MEVVQSQSALNALVASLSTVETIYVDTEFVRTRTYYARPGLIQLNVADTIYLVDPIEVPDLSGLWPTFASRETIKVLHAGQEDLGLIESMSGSYPEATFDTQIAAAFCGLGNGLGYRALVQTLAGVEVPKGETRSDWCQRPLTPSQLDYAVDDVRHLPPVHHTLVQRLTENGRLAWAEEESALSLKQTRARSEPETVYQRVRGAAKLDRKELKALCQLAAWRESEAMAADRPRGHILPDDALIFLVRTKRLNRRNIVNGPSMSPRFVRRHGDTILELIAESSSTETESLPLPLALSRSERPQLQELEKIVQARAGELGLPPELLAGRRRLEAALIESTYRPAPEPAVLQGWRGTVLGDAFRNRLAELSNRASNPS